MPYNDKVILFSGGPIDYVGVLDQRPHKMGKDWYRILNPCERTVIHHQNGGQQELLVSIHGPMGRYKQYVDIKIPENMPIEIRVLDDDGDLVEIYKKQVAMKKSDLIVLPGAGNMPKFDPSKLH